MERRIIHIDMDAFYAQVEQRDNPDLKGKPVIVGGKSRNRGVVATASYEARKFGVHSAMPTARAHQLCPDGYYVSPRFDVYKEVSSQIMSIFKGYTDIVQPVSLDEAYLDITHLVRKDLGASQIAAFIKRDILTATNLTCSAGVSYNKFLAKIASGMNKPNGLTVIHYGNVEQILTELPIGEFPGVGKVTEEKMQRLKIMNGKDLRDKSELELIELFGKKGSSLYQKARGIGSDIINMDRVRKSIGKESTFSHDVQDEAFILQTMRTHSEKVALKLQDLNKVSDTITVKIKTSDFESHTKQTKILDFTDQADTIYNTAVLLYTDLKEEFNNIRLVGVSVGNLKNKVYENLTIYDFL
ncbi:DNA polymerase IV [Macrococcoides bohemicum]|uniref:DNA polymerase IV n=1 Tax=Macrococcoides bohemicum TaxID=1903056 RepID=A0AAJ4TW06_9STAP|nr:DNA polymerase IV [Macrococcus bohemicus]QYA41950.1 DNA polymerase IV [Macrococcus bohemicus]QYA44373.1 DNA polymerase IV [Macrococcus bohemicus]